MISPLLGPVKFCCYFNKMGSLLCLLHDCYLMWSLHIYVYHKISLYTPTIKFIPLKGIIYMPPTHFFFFGLPIFSTFIFNIDIEVVLLHALPLWWQQKEKKKGTQKVGGPGPHSWKSGWATGPHGSAATVHWPSTHDTKACGSHYLHWKNKKRKRVHVFQRWVQNVPILKRVSKSLNYIFLSHITIKSSLGLLFWGWFMLIWYSFQWEWTPWPQ